MGQNKRLWFFVVLVPLIIILGSACGLFASEDEPADIGDFGGWQETTASRLYYFDDSRRGVGCWLFLGEGTGESAISCVRK